MVKETAIQKPEGFREIWRRSPLLRQDYWVSNLGRLRRTTGAGAAPILSKGWRADSHGEKGAGKSILYKVMNPEGKKKQFTAGRLVASAFLGYTGPGNRVVYLDGDAENLRPENLKIAASASEAIREQRARLPRAIASSFTGEPYIRTENTPAGERFSVYLGMRYERFKKYGGQWETLEKAVIERDRLVDRYEAAIMIAEKNIITIK